MTRREHGTDEGGFEELWRDGDDTKPERPGLAFARGSDVHDLEQLERQLDSSATNGIDAVLIAYLYELDALPKEDA